MPANAGVYPYTCSGSGCNLQAGATYFVVAVVDDGSWDN